MEKLTLNDFKKTSSGGELYYYSYLGKNCEICIENGFGCVDIAVYDLKQELLEPKVTLNSPSNNGGRGYDPLELLTYYSKIDEIVNNYYQKWEVEK